MVLAQEQVGTLRGFDVYVNMVLEDVTEYEDTPEGRKVTKLDQILLNGNNIAVLVPGGGGADGPSAAGGVATPAVEEDAWTASQQYSTDI